MNGNVTEFKGVLKQASKHRKPNKALIVKENPKNKVLHTTIMEVINMFMINIYIRQLVS